MADPVSPPCAPPSTSEIVDAAARDFAQTSIGMFRTLDNPMQLNTVGSKFEKLSAPLRDSLAQNGLESMMHGVFSSAFGVSDSTSLWKDAGNVAVNLSGIGLLSEFNRRLTHAVTDQMARSQDIGDQQQAMTQRIADKIDPTFGYSDCTTLGDKLATSGVTGTICAGAGVANPFHGLAGASVGISIKGRF